jgi:hypothetical protein
VDYEERDAVWFGRSVPTFSVKLLLLSSGWVTESSVCSYRAVQIYISEDCSILNIKAFY